MNTPAGIARPAVSPSGAARHRRVFLPLLVALIGLAWQEGRLQVFEEQWLIPAASSLGWMFVAAKTEDGSFFLYLYGDTDPTAMIARLSPFDGSLGFFDEQDPAWDEYAALKELLEEANAMPPERVEKEPAKTPAKQKPAAKGKRTVKVTPKAKAKTKPGDGPMRL